ncbi:MAG: phytase, partial [Rhodocyclaceae bacterium]
MTRIPKRVALLLPFTLLVACASMPRGADREPDHQGGGDPLLAQAGIPHVVVAEAFLTPMTPKDNVDSPALWVGPDGKPLLLATAKATGRLMTYDGETGAALAAVG